MAERPGGIEEEGEGEDDDDSDDRDGPQGRWGGSSGSVNLVAFLRGGRRKRGLFCILIKAFRLH